MSDRGRARAAGQWWRNLTTGWRVNIGLYALASIALIALLVEFSTGGSQKSKQVQVASQARPTTTSVTVPRPSTTLPPSTTTTPPSTTAAGPSTTAAGSGRPSTTASRGSGGGGGGGGVVGVTTTAPPSCHNSTDPRCGPFRYEPATAGNQPLTVSVTPPSVSVRANESVTFQVVVEDPDHSVTVNCSNIDFGDGHSEPPAPCPTTTCDAAYGPWDPPTASHGRQPFTFSHKYETPGSYTARFVFHTDKDTRCPQPDPYGNTGSADVGVTVAAAPAG